MLKTRKQKERMVTKSLMLKVEKFLGMSCGGRGGWREGLLRQLFFVFTALFMFFGFASVVNAVSLEWRIFYRGFPEPGSFDLVDIVVFSSSFDLTVFYISCLFMLLFPLFSKDLRASWKWAVLSYLPLSPSLSSFFFGMPGAGQFFLALSCVLCVLWVFLDQAACDGYGFPKRKGLANVLVYVCVVFLIIELCSLFFLFRFPFLEVSELGGFFHNMAQVEAQFFYLQAFLVPFFTLFALFAWLLTPLHLWMKQRKTPSLLLGKEGNVSFDYSVFEVLGMKPWNMVFLVGAVVLSAVFGLYAYLPVLDGSKQFVGIDTSHYVVFLENMAGEDGLHVLSYAFFGLRERWLSVSLLYFFSVLFELPFGVVAQFSPLVVGPLIVVATYFFMRRARFPEAVCAFAGFVSAFSFVLVMGVFAAFLSNMMAWVVLLVFWGFLIEALRSQSWKPCLLAGCALACVLFLHVYTWSLMMLVLVCLAGYFFLRYVGGFESPRRLKLTSAIVVSNLAIELTRLFFGGLESASSGAAVSLAQSGLSPVFVWLSAEVVLQKFWYGFFMTPAMLFMAAVGVLTVVFDVWPEDFCLPLKFWVAAPSLLFLFGDSVVKTRVLYALPFHVLAALGILSFSCWFSRQFRGSYGKTLAVFFVVLFLLVNVNYALRSMNLVSMYA
ncbi:MAG: hypothetical protein ACLFU9_01340 [Candidatus Bathyarchaeia archaeon]